MTQEISVELMCVQMRSGVEIWAEKEKLDNLMQILQQTSQFKFVTLDGEMFNTADIVGIFTPMTMEKYAHQKKGDWQCNRGTWHGRREDCECGRGDRYGEKEWKPY